MSGFTSNSDPGWEMVAVVGMAGRFPGARTVGEFWRNIKAGVESISFFSEDELKIAGLDPDLLSNPSYIRAGSYLENSDKFDAGFFGYSPREAELMDPQHRVFLECAWTAMEDAGCNPASFGGAIGVYVGVGLNTYYTGNLVGNPELMERGEEYEALFGNEKDFLATRVAYKLDLKGPSFCVQTACSSSLLAVHLACQALLTHECDAALAGGVSLSHHPRVGYLHREGMILSADGHCRAFDAQASGTVTGRGAGAVLLKRLSDALKEGDSIRAIVRGTAVNNDGAQKVSFAAPSVNGQARVIREALQNADIPPETVTYIEAHGTGTALGDPAEIAALTEAFGQPAAHKGFCAIGSVKSNLGHLDAAAGIAGFIKAVLALQYKQIPPSLHFNNPNPAIDFAHSPFYVNTQLKEWKPECGICRAGVSSFGVGGTNVHIVLEEGPVDAAAFASDFPQLLLLSAKTNTALRAITTQLSDFLKQNPESNLSAVAQTLQLGRKHFGHRRFVVCEDVASAIYNLESGGAVCGPPEKEAPQEIVFVCGSGKNVSLRTARKLYARQPAFREAIDTCAIPLKSQLSFDIRALLDPSCGSTQSVGMSDPKLSAPFAFAFYYSLARLWVSWGVQPKALVGEGTGEYVAMSVSQVLSVGQALKLLIAECKGSRAPGDNNGTRASTTWESLHRPSLPEPEVPLLLKSLGKWVSGEKFPDLAAIVGGPQRCEANFKSLLRELLSDSTRIFLTLASPAFSLNNFAHEKLQPVILPVGLSGDEEWDETSLLDSLGRIWSLSFSVDWHTFHAGVQTRRIPLPTYPFESKRYWIEEPRGSGAGRVARASERQEIARWFNASSWKRSLTTLRSAQVSSQQRPIMIFCDQCDLMVQLIANLPMAGERIIRVDIGAAFKMLSPCHYTINPASRADYTRLIEDLQNRGNLPDQIVHGWSVNRVGGPSDQRSFEEAQHHGFYSLLFLMQALLERGAPESMRLDVITNNLQQVIGDEEILPERATILAPCIVIPQECPNVRCRHIDVPWSDSGRDSMVVEQLRNEILKTIDWEDRIIAFRGGNRWVRTVVPVEEESDSTEIPLRKRGVYLITGGLGRLGFALARFLAVKLRARLILTTTAELPDRTNWNAWLHDHSPENPVSKRICQIVELEKSGAEVFPLWIDVADGPGLEAGVARACERFGMLHGVIHAAGIMSGVSIREANHEHCEKHFRAKVNGLLNLVKILEGKQLDFCVVTSSVATLLGGIGYVAYAAANVFMDYFTMRHNRATKVRWVSICWDTWKFHARDSKSPFAFSGGMAITPEEGVEAFRKILTFRGAISPVIVSTTDLAHRIKQSVAVHPSEMTSLTRKSPSGHVRETVSVPYQPPRDDVEKTVASIWCEALGFEQIGIHDNFFELGGYSLLATRIMSRLREIFHNDLGLHSLLSAPTVADLSATIRSYESVPGQTEEIARLFQAVEQMSSEQINELLETGKPYPGGLM